MALLSRTFGTLATSRFFADPILVAAGRPVFVGYTAEPHLVGYYLPDATHCIVLAPRAGLAEYMVPSASAGLLLAPRAASVTVVGP